jgi:hypothetical protein
MDLEFIRAEIEQRRRQIARHRKEILDLQRAGISTKSAKISCRECGQSR